MKPNLKILALLMVALMAAACNKTPDLQPVKKSDLYGSWRSEQPELQWDIVNTQGQGNGPHFTDISQNGHRYLKVDALSIHDTFEITQITEHDMTLTDSKGVQYSFVKMATIRY